MSKHELDDAAYEALKAHPAMVEEAVTNLGPSSWATVSRYLNGGMYAEIGRYMSYAVDAYVKGQVEEFANDEEISVNEAIHKLLNRCSGGK